jgi:bifunctional UDP-N-acetylglucosamine pyrophosphorylase/glucosamine-1-phosphate N-acetyltransferase
VGDGVEYILQKEQRGTGHALQQAKPLFQDYPGDALILSGDVPLIREETLKELVKTHRDSNAAGTLLTTELKDPTGYGRVIRKTNDKIDKIVEESDASLFEKAVEEINSGIYCFHVASLFEVIDTLSAKNRQGEFYLTDVIEILSDKGKELDSVTTADPNEILGVNSREELAKVEKILQHQIKQKHMQSGVTIVDPDSTYIEASVKIGRDTVIFPFTVIEGNTEIGCECKVGPFTRLRTGTVLKNRAEVGNFVETKKTVIGEKAKAKHLSYLGDATIGEGVNIGAGTITANYDGTSKYPTSIGDHAFIGSNTTLIAPVSIGKNAVTGAGSVVVKGQDVPNGGTVVGVPARPLSKRKKTKKTKKN